MLIKDFYRFKQFQTTDDIISGAIILNPAHGVYKGHFPGRPVVPGVIQLQIIKEMLEKGLGEKLFLGTIVSAKYYSLISPVETPELDISVQYKLTETGKYKIGAQISRGETVFSKVRAVLSVQK